MLDVCTTVLLSHARDSTDHTWRSLVILYAGQGIHEFGIQGYLATRSSGTGTRVLCLPVPSCSRGPLRVVRSNDD